MVVCDSFGYVASIACVRYNVVVGDYNACMDHLNGCCDFDSKE